MRVSERARFAGRLHGGAGVGIATVGIALAVPAFAIAQSIDTIAVHAVDAVDSVIGTWLIAAALGAYAAADAADRAQRRLGPRTWRAAAVVGVLAAVCAPALLWVFGADASHAAGTAEISGAVVVVVEMICVLGLTVGLAAVRLPFVGALLITAAVALWVTVVGRAAVGYLSSTSTGGAQAERVLRQADLLQTWLPLASALGGAVAVLVGARLVESTRSTSGRLMLVAATPVLFALTLSGLALLSVTGSVGGLDVPGLLWLTAGCLAGLAVHGATTPA